MDPLKSFFGSIKQASEEIAKATSKIPKSLSINPSDKKAAQMHKSLQNKSPQATPTLKRSIQNLNIPLATLIKQAKSLTDLTFNQLSENQLDREELKDIINSLKYKLSMRDEATLGKEILNSDESLEDVSGGSGYSSLDYETEDNTSALVDSDPELRQINQQLMILQLIEENFENPLLQLVLKNRNINCDDPTQRIENLNRHLQNIIEQENKETNLQDLPKAISKDQLIKEGLKEIPKPTEENEDNVVNIEEQMKQLTDMQKREIEQIFNSIKSVWGEAKIPDETKMFMIKLFTSDEDAKNIFMELIETIEEEGKIAKKNDSFNLVEVSTLVMDLYFKALEHPEGNIAVNGELFPISQKLKALTIAICERNFLAWNSQAITDELPVLIDPNRINDGKMVRSKAGYSAQAESSNLGISGFRLCAENTYVRNQFSNNINKGGSTITQNTTLATVKNNNEPGFIRFSSQLALHSFPISKLEIQAPALTDFVGEISNIALQGQKNAYMLWLENPQPIVEKFGMRPETIKIALKNIFLTEIPDGFVEWLVKGCDPDKKQQNYDQLFAKIDQLILDISNFNADAQKKYFSSLNMLTQTKV